MDNGKLIDVIYIYITYSLFNMIMMIFQTYMMIDHKPTLTIISFIFIFIIAKTSQFSRGP